MDKVKVHPLGQGAVLFTLSQEQSESANDRVRRICTYLDALHLPGIEETQPAYSSFCVHFDPEITKQKTIEDAVETALSNTEGDRSQKSIIRELEIPVVYGGKWGLDLAWAAEHLGISQEELARRHQAQAYKVHMLGFTPGFPYLGGMDPSISLPRLPSPRLKVPKGAVGIAGGQTGIYPSESPGGWRILGRTPAVLFDPKNPNPSLCRPGDILRFVSIDNWDWPEENAEKDTEHTAPSHPAIQIEHPGLFTVVVDLGRKGYRSQGVPVGGAADERSYNLANALVGNKKGAPALEMCLWGATIRFRCQTTIAITGAPVPLSLDSSPLPMNQAVVVEKDAVLTVGSPTEGCRMYLAIQGGLDIRNVLGSASPCLLGGFGGRALRPGDILGAGSQVQYSTTTEPDLGWPADLSTRLQALPVALSISPGPEAEDDPSLMAFLLQNTFTVGGDSNKMGVRLKTDSTKRPTSKGDILSSPVVPGTVQIPHDGNPVLLHKDAQTTGGYRRAAIVARPDLDIAAQLRPGNSIRFTLCPNPPR